MWVTQWHYCHTAHVQHSAGLTCLRWCLSNAFWTVPLTCNKKERQTVKTGVEWKCVTFCSFCNYVLWLLNKKWRLSTYVNVNVISWYITKTRKLSLCLPEGLWRYSYACLLNFELIECVGQFDTPVALPAGKKPWYPTLIYRPTAVAQWLRCCATNRKVAGSIPDGVTGIFHWHKILPIALALESTQPLTEMSKWVLGAFPGVKAAGA